MIRITDPEKSRAFYEALGFRLSRDMDVVRCGELEATNYFFSIGDHENVLELTYNHDGRTYDLGTGYGHIAIGVDDLDGTLAQLKEQQGSSRSDRHTLSLGPRGLPRRAEVSQPRAGPASRILFAVSSYVSRASGASGDCGLAAGVLATGPVKPP